MRSLVSGKIVTLNGPHLVIHSRICNDGKSHRHHIEREGYSRPKAGKRTSLVTRLETDDSANAGLREIRTELPEHDDGASPREPTVRQEVLD